MNTGTYLVLARFLFNEVPTKDLLEIQRMARQGAAQRMTRPERITKAKEIKARLAENEREHAKLCKELKLYSNHYNRREEIDWKDNDRRAAELDKLIEDSGIMRKEIARYVAITPSYLSRLLRSKRQPLSQQMEEEIRDAIVHLDTERRINANKARAERFRKGKSDGSKADAGAPPVA